MDVIEVLVTWGNNPLRVVHLAAGQEFSVGDERVVTSKGALVVGAHVKGWVEHPGEPRRLLVPGGEVALRPGTRAHMEAGVVYDVSMVPAEPPPPSPAFEREPHLASGLSLVLHAGVLASLALLVPRTDDDDVEVLHRDNMLLMQHLLESSADASSPAEQNDVIGSGTERDPVAGALVMGNPAASKTKLRYAVAGPQDNPDPHLARLAALHEAAEFGMISLLGANAGDPNAPVADWGRESALGNDPSSAQANMWGDAIGDSFGFGGLGLTGTGGCGCGAGGEGIGLVGIGTIGRGSGTVGGDGYGHGRVGGTHLTRAPSIATSNEWAITSGLPAEIVQRIVRQSFGRMRACYEDGLRTNASLQGRVTVKFVIDRDGSVTTAQDGGSDLPDVGVRQCVVRSFANLSFPEPTGGIVTVVYPLLLSPSS